MVLNSVVLPTPFGPITPTMPLRGSEKDRPSISLRSPSPSASSSLQNNVAQARSGRDLDLFKVELAGALGFFSHLLVAGQTCLLLGLAALGVGANPFEFVLQTLGKLGVLLALNLKAVALLSR